MDAPEGESLGFSQNVDVYRQFSGPAHLANKTIISSELGAVQIGAYVLTVRELLQQVKRSLAGGFTMHVLHGFPASTTYTNTTWPGYTTFWYEYTDMWNQVQPAWQHMEEHLDFVGRTQWTLQQGSPKVDLAFYLYGSPWLVKSQYNSTNLKDLGYTYDYLGPDNLASPEAFVANGKLGIPEYKALILNNQSVASVQAAEAMIDVASKGLPIIIVGSPPSQSYPTNSTTQSALDSAVKRLLSSSGVQRVDTIDRLPTVLAGESISPRVALNCTTNPVYSVWRSSGDRDYIYFLNDQSAETHCSAQITASGVAPFVYNAWTGSRSPLLQYTATNSSLLIPISLKSNESTIIVLDKSSPPSQCTFSSTNGSIQYLNASDGNVQAVVTGPTTLTSSTGKSLQLGSSLAAPLNLTSWDLVIEDWHSAPDRFAVETEITNHTLHNVTLRPWNQLDATLNPVSGVGHYTTKFTVPASYTNSSKVTAVLKLPLIQNTARVFLDGAWVGPIDPVNPVTTLQGLASGQEHSLRIDVTSTLFNRIKAEANETWVVGQVAAQRQPKYNTAPYEGYGLAGSVMLEWGELVDVEC